LTPDSDGGGSRSSCHARSLPVSTAVNSGGAASRVREGLGGLLVLLGLAAFNSVELAVNGRPALGAFPLFAVPGALFLLSALLRRRGQAATGGTLKLAEGRRT
jgi:hypothetical protein